MSSLLSWIETAAEIWRDEVGPYVRVFANLYRKIPPKSKFLFLKNGSKWKKFAWKSISEAENWLRPRKYASPQSHATNFSYFEFLEKYGLFCGWKMGFSEIFAIFAQKSGHIFSKTQNIKNLLHAIVENHISWVWANFQPQKLIFRRVFSILSHFSKTKT